jgi:hypothetical protein
MPQDEHRRRAHLEVPCEVTFYPEGNLIQVKQKRFPKIYPLIDETGDAICMINLSKQKKRTRGKIKTFSRGSKQRLMHNLAKVVRHETPLFLTLTYPSSYPTALESKKHLRRFLKRLKRRFGDVLGYLWKLEFQRRGAPHYHLFLWGITGDFGAELRGWIAEAWADVCDMHDENHVKAGTSLEKIRKWQGARSYARKYMGKIDETEREQGIGRVWGMGGKIPISSLLTVPLTPKARHKLLRYLRRRVKTKSLRMRNFVVDDPWRWFSQFQELTDPLPF